MEGLLNTSAEGQNRSRLVQSGWEGRQIQPKGMIFFLTSLFIEHFYFAQTGHSHFAAT
jgi:hypothetical protein